MPQHPCWERTPFGNWFLWHNVAIFLSKQIDVPPSCKRQKVCLVVVRLVCMFILSHILATNPFACFCSRLMKECEALLSSTGAHSEEESNPEESIPGSPESTERRRNTVTFNPNDPVAVLYAPEETIAVENYALNDSFFRIRRRVKWIFFAIFFVTIPVITFILVGTGMAQQHVDAIGHHESGCTLLWSSQGMPRSGVIYRFSWDAHMVGMWGGGLPPTKLCRCVPNGEGGSPPTSKWHATFCANPPCRFQILHQSSNTLSCD